MLLIFSLQNPSINPILLNLQTKIRFRLRDGQPVFLIELVDYELGSIIIIVHLAMRYFFRFF